MKILAVDTTSLTATAAVVDSGKLLGEITINNKLTHSQTMMPMIEDLLSKLDLSVTDIDGFAVSSGPGSFTGIKIGISSMSALAYTVKKPIVGVPTLDVLAMNACFANDLVVPLINARNHQVYAAVYKTDNFEMARISDFWADDLNVILDEVKKTAMISSCKTITFVGDGVLAYSNDISEYANVSSFNIKLSNEIDSVVSAKWVGLIGEKLLEESFSDNFEKDNVNNYVVEPIYLRKSQAERLLEEQNK